MLVFDVLSHTVVFVIVNLFYGCDNYDASVKKVLNKDKQLCFQKSKNSKNLWHTYVIQVLCAVMATLLD